MNTETLRFQFIKLLLTNPDLLVSLLFIRPVLTDDYLNYVYNTVLEIFKNLEISNLKPITDGIHIENREAFEEISNIIQHNGELSKRIEELSDYDCGCVSKNLDQNGFIDWDFPIICSILSIVAFIGVFIAWIFRVDIIAVIAFFFGSLFDCPWYK